MTRVGVVRRFHRATSLPSVSVSLTFVPLAFALFTLALFLFLYLFVSLTSVLTLTFYAYWSLVGLSSGLQGMAQKSVILRHSADFPFLFPELILGHSGVLLAHSDAPNVFPPLTNTLPEFKLPLQSCAGSKRRLQHGPSPTKTELRAEPVLILSSVAFAVVWKRTSGCSNCSLQNHFRGYLTVWWPCGWT